MSTPPTLDRFLADLGTRRERLLRLVEPSRLPDADLLAEITELGEQLVVADEELRVQQEELDGARRALVNLSLERELLLRHSTRPFVVTDAAGVVVQATPVVEQLIRQPPIRLVPRPIATWFQVSDRRTVRAMISRVQSDTEPQYAERLTVRTGDGSTQVVDLAVALMPDPAGGRMLLRWELIPAQVPDLHLASDRRSEPAAERLQAAITELGALAAALADHPTEEMFPLVLDAALRLIPGADHAGLLLRGPGGVPGPAAWSSETARRADAAQLEAGTGPLVQAMTASGPVRADRLGQTMSSRGERQADEPLSALAVPLVRGPHRHGVLTVYGDGPAAFDDEDADLLATALGRHVTVALAGAAQVAGLHTAIDSRQVIGGAVGVLTERHRITPDAAFAMLVRRSQHTNHKLRDIAEVVLATGQDPDEITLP